MSDSNATELLLCPFCGGEAEVYEMQYGVDGQYSVFGVFCVDDSNSELIGLSKYQHGHFIDNFPTEAKAIEAWNSRAERTCKIESSYLNDFTSNHECWYEFEMQCGYKFTWDEIKPPTYCPNCGAKVVNRDE